MCAYGTLFYLRLVGRTTSSEVRWCALGVFPKLAFTGLKFCLECDVWEFEPLCQRRHFGGEWSVSASPQLGRWPEGFTVFPAVDGPPAFFASPDACCASLFLPRLLDWPPPPPPLPPFLLSSLPRPPTTIPFRLYLVSFAQDLSTIFMIFRPSLSVNQVTLQARSNVDP